jgi:hypothetical protein
MKRLTGRISGGRRFLSMLATLTTARSPPPCNEAVNDCTSWKPRVIEDPGWLTRVLILSAFPTFLAGVPLVRVLGRHGASEVWSFMVLMPLLITAWYYAVGWLLDRWICRGPRPT